MRRAILIALFLVGCGGEAEMGTVSNNITTYWVITTSVCGGSMIQEWDQQANPTVVTGSWACGSYAGSVNGTIQADGTTALGLASGSQSFAFTGTTSPTQIAGNAPTLGTFTATNQGAAR